MSSTTRFQTAAVAACVALACLAGAAQAEQVQVPLPQLTGPYSDGGTERIASLQLSIAPASIQRAWVEFSGVLQAGLRQCGSTLFVWGMEFRFGVGPAPTNLQWRVSGVTELEGGFFFKAFLEPVAGANWDFLLNGGVAALNGQAEPTNCTIVDTPSAVLTEVNLMFQIDTTLPVEPATWGRIKALYELSAVGGTPNRPLSE